jgi:hypothetical protein
MSIRRTGSVSVRLRSSRIVHAGITFHASELFPSYALGRRNNSNSSSSSNSKNGVTHGTLRAKQAPLGPPLPPIGLDGKEIGMGESSLHLLESRRLNTTEIVCCQYRR